MTAIDLHTFMNAISNGFCLFMQQHVQQSKRKSGPYLFLVGPKFLESCLFLWVSVKYSRQDNIHHMYKYLTMLIYVMTTKLSGLPMTWTASTLVPSFCFALLVILLTIFENSLSLRSEKLCLPQNSFGF